MTRVSIAAAIPAAALLAATLSATPARASANGMFGNWITEDRSVVRVYECGPETLCARLIHTVEPNSIDDQNPDKQLRNRPICGVQLGKDFRIVDQSHAKGGRFYDPNTGKTYSAAIALDGDLLKVRGYVGVALFGRSETWHRTKDDLAVCKA